MGEKKTIAFSLNGVNREFRISPDDMLLDLLRREGYTGTKHGCGEATCGSCTVIMDGRAVYACILYAFQAQGRDIRTIEGEGDFDNPTPLQAALVEEGAVQCGFCIPGMVMAAKALMDADPAPDDEKIRQYMDGNLCRCTGYEKIEDALHKVIDGRASGSKGGA